VRRRDRDKNRFRDDKFGNKKSFGSVKRNSEIKVVSTNVTKEKEESKNPPKQSFRERQGRSRSDNYNNRGREEAKKSFPPKPRRNLEAYKNIMSFQPKTLDKEKCTICTKLIDDMPSAIFDKEKNEYYHFNCVLTKVESENKIEGRERIAYLGSGSFGIIENTGGNSSSKFSIKKKIQFITVPQK
jgi:hypothetical protein